MVTRPIKFRAWDTIDNEWKYSGYPHQPMWKFWESVELNGGYENVCQYTGLKDKNGREIYEGDILKISNEFGGLGEPKEFVRKVSWQDRYGAGWYFGLSYKDGEKRWSFVFEPDCEIIGTVYENPELLEGKS